MGRRKKGTPPAYRKHQGGQAFSVYQGQPYYFGRHGTPESRTKYKAFLTWWEEKEQALPTAAVASVRTVGDLVNTFLIHARSYYVDEAGEPTSQYHSFRCYFGQLLEHEADTSLEQFNRTRLLAQRDRWAATVSRYTVNKALSWVRHLFRWGYRERYVSGTVLLEVRETEPLSKGRSMAREHDPVQPVPDMDLEATLMQARPQLADMLRVQVLVGCRPGELRRLRGGELVRQGSVRLQGRTIPLPEGLWAFLPSRHKNKHRGQVLAYWVGPQAQALLAAHLLQAGDGYLFPTRHSPYYSREGYWRAVRNAAERAGVPAWSPGQLRHNTLSRYDNAAGIQAASTIVGHTRVETTQIYAERNLQQAAELVTKMG